MKPTIEAASLLGLTEETATRMLSRLGQQYRITHRNNKPNICTRDFKSERFNLEINEGRITGVHMG